MVIDHANSLHKGIANCGSNEFESSVFQILAHGIRFSCVHRNLTDIFPFVYNCFVMNKLPDIMIKAAIFLLYL